MASIKLQNIEKVYDNGFHAVHNFNLEIQNNEINEFHEIAIFKTGVTL